MKKLTYYLFILILAVGCSKDSDPDPGVQKPVPGGPGGESITITCNDDITINDIPQAARDFITEYYDGYKVDDVKRCTASGATYYEVEVESGNREFYIYFDGSGSHVATVDEQGNYSTSPPTRPPKIPGTGGGEIELTCNVEVPIAYLPEKAASLIYDKFPGFKIDDVKICTDGTSVKYWVVEVETETADELQFWVLFDEDGDYLAIADAQGNISTDPIDRVPPAGPDPNPPTYVTCGTSISFSDLPGPAQSFVTTNYLDNGWSIDDVEQCSDNNGKRSYKVELEKSGESDIDLYFDENGNNLN